nr:MAG TPA: transmembrane protein [Bacteriophage sp.]
MLVTRLLPLVSGFVLCCLRCPHYIIVFPATQYCPAAL